MSVKHMDDIAIEPVGVGDRAFRQVLISNEEGPHFALRRFVIEPGGSMPVHTNTVEHEQYVLGGEAEIGIGDAIYRVGRNDVVFIPSGVPHWYRSIGNVAFEFLCVVPNQPDCLEVLEKR